LIKNNSGLSEETKFAVLHHHECMMGTGYPKHLRKNQIGIQTKIVSIADIFNALVTDRPYQKALSPYKALTYMKEIIPIKISTNI